jgi:predicted DCC family thiol-disulfide oxidoreductase YuxK
MDRQKVFRFAPLGSDTAEKLLGPVFPSFREHESIILYHQGEVFLRSTAVLRIMDLLGWPYKFLCIGNVLPRSIRDVLYDAVAARRYRFGKRYESCPLVPEEWRDRFIHP